MAAVRYTDTQTYGNVVPPNKRLNHQRNILCQKISMLLSIRTGGQSGLRVGSGLLLFVRPRPRPLAVVGTSLETSTASSSSTGKTVGYVRGTATGMTLARRRTSADRNAGGGLVCRQQPNPAINSRYIAAQQRKESRDGRRSHRYFLSGGQRGYRANCPHERPTYPIRLLPPAEGRGR